MSPGRVLLICGEYPPVLGGISDYSRLLARGVAARGWEVEVLTTALPDHPRSAVDDGVRVERGMDGWRLRDLPAALRAAERAGEGVVVHIQYPAVAFRRNPMINLLPAILRARVRSAKVAVTVHDARVMRRRWRARLAPMLSAAHAIVHVDEPDRDYLERWRFAGRPAFSCIPIGANIPRLPVTPQERERWRREIGLEGADPVVAFFGMLYPHKGLRELVEAVVRIRAGGRPLRLLVVGDFDRAGPYEGELTELLRPGIDAGTTVWLRGPEPAAVSRAMHAADIAALPFHSGAASNRSSLLTAIAHGLPTVTTRGPATPPDFEDSFPVRLVPPRDAAALAAEIGSLLGSLDLASADRPLPATTHEWELVADRHIELYEQLTRSSRGSR